MKSAIYTAHDTFDKSSLKVVVKGLYEDIHNGFGSYDYLLFALPPTVNIEKASQYITQYFHTEAFLVFHAIEHFNNEKIVKNSLSACCLQFQKNASLKPFCIPDITEKGSVEKVSHYLNNNRDKFHIVLAGLCDGEVGSFVEEISQKLNYTPIDNIVGGVSSGINKEGKLQAFQYIGKKLIEHGFILLSFSNIEACIDVALGFKAYGITYEITKAKGNKLYSVDDGKSFSYIAKKMLNALEGEFDIRNLWYSPLSILNAQNGYVETVRTVANIQNNYVEFFAPLKEGDFFKLSFATPKDLLKTDKEVATFLHKKMSEPELAFNFSCIARQYVLEDQHDKESAIYVEKFNTNLFGFFTFGEIGPDKMQKKLKFYNETSLVAVMREK
jgi:hypothetical protein